MFSPDRLPNPHAHEVGYYYQNIWVTPLNLQEGRILVKNEFFFRQTQNISLQWELLADGEVVERGIQPLAVIRPQGEAEVQIPYHYEAADHNKELLLNVDFILTQDELPLTAGMRIAHEQLHVHSPSSLTSGENALALSTSTADIHVTGDDNRLYVRSSKTELVFDKNSGFLCKYVVAGKTYLGEGGVLQPNFWRAVTDNDMGAELQKHNAVWRKPELKLRAMDVREGKGEVTISSSYDMTDAHATLQIDYAITPDGTMKVTQQMKSSPEAKVADLPRFGMMMKMPSDINLSRFYGRGPVENYSDRKGSQRIGIYQQTAEEQFYPYIRPQETGTKGDIRWWRQTDIMGQGIIISSDKPFYASALPYELDELDEGDAKHQRHPTDLSPSPFVNLFIDGYHAGLGGIDSWTRQGQALGHYRLKYQDYTIRFTFKPI